jgi:hypothetical protein
MNPYLLMAVLYLSLAGLTALDASLISLNLMPWFGGMRWLRVHLVTLGTLTQVIFGLLPIIVARQHGVVRPPFRWATWLALNGGVLALLIGIPLKSTSPIISGGVLVGLATILLGVQLNGMRSRPAGTEERDQAGISKKFYVTGLIYFLVGILVGSGLWTGLVGTLNIGTPIEVHIHANSWGLMSLVFAGLWVDLYPTWAKRPLANPNSISAIYWLMTLGAFGLVFGPWLPNRPLLVVGLVAHLIATLWLLSNVIRPLWRERSIWSMGLIHMVAGYFWILAPVMMAPFVLFKVGNLPSGTIEATAPQALVYGWLLQFGYAVIPYFFTLLLRPDLEPRLGGNRITLVLVNAGGVLLWASIFIDEAQQTLHGLAYLMWALSFIPVLSQLWRTIPTSFSPVDAG